LSLLEPLLLQSGGNLFRSTLVGERRTRGFAVFGAGATGGVVLRTQLEQPETVLEDDAEQCTALLGQIKTPGVQTGVFTAVLHKYTHVVLPELEKAEVAAEAVHIETLREHSDIQISADADDFLEQKLAAHEFFLHVVVCAGFNIFHIFHTFFLNADSAV
jgi:hypothetical protein